MQNVFIKGVGTLTEKPKASRTARHASLRGAAALAILLGTLWPIPRSHAFNLSRAETERIGHKIWQNECNGTLAGLTSWNSGENFASLGIGHFIWYPKGARGPFEESFPKVVDFISSRGAKLPELLLGGRERTCPWNSRAEFERDAQSKVMKQLRLFLAGTVDEQAQFLVLRLEQALPKMLAASASGRTEIQRQFNRVAASGASGSYALVDYVNFKGEGVLATERYRGEGWGLLQVLQGMSGAEKEGDAVGDFAASARKVLTHRVKNSPPERNESRWLQGWLARVNTYTRG